MPVLETLRCPSCSTRFGLRASRVHAGIRRAQCFRCTTVFGIEEAVAHLLAPPVVMADVPADLPPSLTLGDLEGAEEEIMEKTLITLPPPAPEEALEAQDSPYAANGPGFASARDAIAKLMGAPLAPKAQRSTLARPGAMDVEATLSALDDTLGGQRVDEPQPAAPQSAAPQSAAPQSAAPQPAPPQPAAPQPAAPEAAPHAASPMASTMKLTMSEIQAALAAALPAQPPVPHAPVVATVPNPARIETASMHLPPQPPQDPSLPQDPNLLKVQLDNEIYNNVTIEQMGAWVEEGRVHEFDMVARQFSEHWIEASKVPALRPIFDQRRRRQAPGQDDLPIPPTEILPQKKGLFGGLFSRN